MKRSALLMPVPTVALPAVNVPIKFLDRDHSILAFNERVLDWARRVEVPLLERLRFLCIVSSNLDEFFEVRAAPHLTAAQNQEQVRIHDEDQITVEPSAVPRQ